MIPRLWCVVVFMCLLGVSAASADNGGLPVVDSTIKDNLDAANQRVGAGGTAFGQGEQVSLFSGNLHVSHPSSGVFTIDGGLSFGLSRAYNSNRPHYDKVRLHDDDNGEPVYKELLSGRSWVGLGWVSHLGRIYQASRYYGPAPGVPFYAWEEMWLESPDGSVYRFEPSVLDAHPNLDIFENPGCQQVNPWPPEDCGDPQEPECDWERWDPPGCGEEQGVIPMFYEVTYPDGTWLKLEELHPYSVTESNWIHDYDRSGWYAREIRDVSGNTVKIEYWGDDENYSYDYPEAIRKIYSEDNPGMLIETLICEEGDPVESCPEPGLLKEVRTRTFQTSAAGYEAMSHQFSYGTLELADGLADTGTTTVPILKQVTVRGVHIDEASGVATPDHEGGTIVYEYGQGLAAENASLVDRITYPLGAVSEYEYGAWTSGTRVIAGPPEEWVLEDRQTTGVVSRLEYPEGDGPDQSHYSWAWAHEFKSTYCGTSIPSGMITNIFELTDPLGLVTSMKVTGNPCGKEDDDLGSFGSVRESILRDENGDPFRTFKPTDHSLWDAQTEEVVKSLVQSTTTIFHDGLGCFASGSQTDAPTVTTEFHQRDDESHWRVMRITGDYFKNDFERIESSKFVTEETANACQLAKKITGEVTEFFVEEVVGEEGLRYEEAFDYEFAEEGGDACAKRKVTHRVRDEWAVPSTEIGNPPAGEPNNDMSITDVAPGGDVYDVISQLEFNASGNLSKKLVVNQPGYPDGTPRSLPHMSFTWANGRVSESQVEHASFKSTDITTDTNGYVTASRNPDGLEAVYSYDSLGRQVEFKPPTGQGPITQTLYDETDLSVVQALAFPRGDSSYDANEPDHFRSEQQMDGKERVISSRHAGPDGAMVEIVTRYDQLGRVIFRSVPILEANYASMAKITWQADTDGDGVFEFVVTGIPSENEKPLGTVYFYGDPSGGDAGNPLAVTPDPLGRVRKVQAPDGSETLIDYCGPHREVTTKGVQTSLGATSDVTNRYYYDGLGRLVLVDAPPGSVDAEYSYDPRGNLTRVNLIEFTEDNPYPSWQNGTLPVGQVREFLYDAAGRLQGSDTPEQGRVWPQTDGLGNVTGDQRFHYNGEGRPLVWQDQLAVERGYFFRSIFDDTGVLLRTEKVLGSPDAPAGAGVDRLGGDGSFETGLGAWELGSLDENGIFTHDRDGDGVADEPYWRRQALGGSFCVAAPPEVPDKDLSTHALYFGDSCGYSQAPEGAEVARYYASQVDRDDVLSFRLWRHVREGGANKDALSVYVVPGGPGATDMLQDRRLVLRLDSEQVSYATWRQPLAVRPADLFTDSEWDQMSSGLWLLFIFEKGDTTQAGLGSGVLVDEVFLGRRDTEVLVEYSYEDAHCGNVEDPVDESICASGHPDREAGAPTTITSYQDGRMVSRRRLAYRSAGGQLSGEQLELDWTGLGSTPETWLIRYEMTDSGALYRRTAPYRPGEEARWYAYSYHRGALTGLVEQGGDGRRFIVDTGAGGITYNVAGGVDEIRFDNDTTGYYGADSIGRLTDLGVLRTSEGVVLWSTGDYSFDGAGNITGIGAEQEFAYDGAGRLTLANVIASAQDGAGAGDVQHIEYSYDGYGNMTCRGAPDGYQESFPEGFEFSGEGCRSYNDNRIQGPNYSYEPSGNMSRFEGKAEQAVLATWDPFGRMTSFYDGLPEGGSSTGIERYLYEGGRLRAVRSEEHHSGEVTLSIRDVTGTVVAEYQVDPASGEAVLASEFVYGVGQLLVERAAGLDDTQSLYAASPLEVSGAYSFEIPGAPADASYDLRIETTNGYLNHILGVVPDSGGGFTVDESEFSPGDTNFLRIRRVEPTESTWSGAVSFFVDDTVTSSSDNQVRAISADRAESDITIRWDLLEDNGKAFNVYARRTDGAATYLLSPGGLDPSARSLVLSSQALSSPCVEFYLTQLTPNAPPAPPTESDASPGAVFHAQLENPGQGCPGVGPAPTPDKSAFANRFHHRDHLGTLRVVTSDSGSVLEALDFYPFGMEMAFPGAGATSSRKFTGHERDERTGMDYMMARYRGNWSDRFASPDPIRAASAYAPMSWNRYAYVLGNPISYSDPSGLRPKAVTIEEHRRVTAPYPPTPTVQMGDLMWAPGMEFLSMGLGGVSDPIPASVLILILQITEDEKSLKQRLCEAALNAVRPPDGSTASVGLSGIVGAAAGAQASLRLGITGSGRVLLMGSLVVGGVIIETTSLGVVGGWYGTEDVDAMSGLGADVGASFALGLGGGLDYVTNLTRGNPTERWHGIDVNVAAGQGFEFHAMVGYSQVVDVGSISAFCSAFVGALEGSGG